MSNQLLSATEFPLVISSMEAQLDRANEDIKSLQKLLDRAGTTYGGDNKNLTKDYVVNPGDDVQTLSYCIRKLKKGLADKKLNKLELTRTMNKLIAVYEVVYDCTYNKGND